MLKIGRRQRHIANLLEQTARPRDLGASLSEVSRIVQGRKSKPGVIQNPDGSLQAVTMQENLLASRGIHIEGPNVVTAADLNQTNSGPGSSGFGQNNSRVDRFNPVYDDLSRGSVAEDWIPRDPRLQNRMFRMMYHRGLIEGPVVETIAELCWSDFDIVGIRDKSILDTYEAAKEAVRPDRSFEDITKEYLVIGRCVIQLVLDDSLGIWTDMIIHNSDYLQIGDIPRTGYMPKIDVLPSPELQKWVKSNDPRDIEARKGLPKALLDQLNQNKPIPLDPTITAYLPRRSLFGDIYGTSFYVRNIPLWGLEKSLINATLTGHRRRSGPITQIAVGSEQWEPSPEQIDALVSAYTAAEEDAVSSTIGTRYDVQFNQIRGGLQEMWKWPDEFAFLQEAKLKMFGVSESLITGEANIDTTTAPTIFLERLKAHRRYVVENFLMQKFFRGLATVHNFRKRSQAELSHRIRVNNDDHELILPSLAFHRNLDVAADTARADLLDKMEEKGLPVTSQEWNRTLGGGDLMQRMRSAVEDLGFKLEALRFKAIQSKINAMMEAPEDQEDLDTTIEDLKGKLKNLNFASDEEALEVAELSKKGKKRAQEMAEDAGGVTTSSSVIHPGDTSATSNPIHDLSIDHVRRNRDPETLNRVGRAC